MDKAPPGQAAIKIMLERIDVSSLKIKLIKTQVKASRTICIILALIRSNGFFKVCRMLAIVTSAPTTIIIKMTNSGIA